MPIVLSCHILEKTVPVPGPLHFHILPPSPRALFSCRFRVVSLPRLSNQPLTNSVVETQLKLASTLPPCMYSRTLHYLPLAPVSQQCGDYGETQTGEFLNYSDYDGRAMICSTEQILDHAEFFFKFILVYSLKPSLRMS